MIKSVLAAVVAIALVVGAVYVRSTFIEGSGPGGEPPGEPDVPVDTDLVVACDEILGPSCPTGSSRMDLDELLVAFESASPDFDVLVAPSVVVEFIEQSQRSDTTFVGARTVVAVTPLVMAVATARDEVVAEGCSEQVSWDCAADLITGRLVEPALADPQRDSAALLGYAALTGGFVDSTQYSRNDLGGSTFIGWLDAVESQVGLASAPVQQLIQFGGARNDAAVTTEAVGLETVRRAAQNVPDLFWPTPLASLQVVAVGVGDTDEAAVQDLGNAVGQALQGEGWRGPDGQPVSEGPAADLADDGLPSGGTLFALRDLLS